MTGPVAQRLGGDRLHLQHGPIDLIIGADGAREAAFALARHRFSTILQELMTEYPLLRLQNGGVAGETAQRMARAVAPHGDVFVTRMAAVAGAVADTVLAAMRGAPLHRAYVNNGGDIALFLAKNQRFDTAMADHTGAALGMIRITAQDGIGGMATSGRHGRSLSRGIAESVSVLARTAAEADVAATLIANAVDLRDHPGIKRARADDVSPDSDLGARRVVVAVPRLSADEIATALDAGLRCARDMQQRGLISDAALFLQGQTRTTTRTGFEIHTERSIAHA